MMKDDLLHWVLHWSHQSGLMLKSVALFSAKSTMCCSLAPLFKQELRKTFLWIWFSRKLAMNHLKHILIHLHLPSDLFIFFSVNCHLWFKFVTDIHQNHHPVNIIHTTFPIICLIYFAYKCGQSTQQQNLV